MLAVLLLPMLVSLLRLALTTTSVLVVVLGVVLPSVPTLPLYSVLMMLNRALLDLTLSKLPLNSPTLSTVVFEPVSLISPF
ncbi:hypothetical protein [Moraxella lacunata]|uniref:hypothetical protein n=1 Tax=Moraxella lacunata TaxID=477 RepID=UPI003EE15E9F